MKSRVTVLGVGTIKNHYCYKANVKSVTSMWSRFAPQNKIKILKRWMAKSKLSIKCGMCIKLYYITFSSSYVVRFSLKMVSMWLGFKKNPNLFCHQTRKKYGPPTRQIEFDNVLINLFYFTWKKNYLKIWCYKRQLLITT